jgi:hypothetical protein
MKTETRSIDDVQADLDRIVEERLHQEEGLARDTRGATEAKAVYGETGAEEAREEAVKLRTSADVRQGRLENLARQERELRHELAELDYQAGKAGIRAEAEALQEAIHNVTDAMNDALDSDLGHTIRNALALTEALREDDKALLRLEHKAGRTRAGDGGLWESEKAWMRAEAWPLYHAVRTLAALMDGSPFPVPPPRQDKER